MDLIDMLDENLIALDLEVKDKDEALNVMIEMLYKSKKITNKTIYKNGILKRESEFSTGIGRGIAIPHCMSEVAKEAVFAIATLKNPVHWMSLDDKPVTLIIMLVVPNDRGDIHLKLLSQLATNLMDEEFSEGLLNASSVEDIKKVFYKGGE